MQNWRVMVTGRYLGFNRKRIADTLKISAILQASECSMMESGSGGYIRLASIDDLYRATYLLKDHGYTVTDDDAFVEMLDIPYIELHRMIHLGWINCIHYETTCRYVCFRKRTSRMSITIKLIFYKEYIQLTRNLKGKNMDKFHTDLPPFTAPLLL